MPITSSPLSDILRFISDYWVLILVFVIWVLRMVGRGTRPPAAGPRPVPRPVTPVAAPPRPTTLPRTQQAVQAMGQKFRPQQPGRLANAAPARARIERFATEQKDMEQSVPEALGTPLTSATASTPAGSLFDPNGPMGGPGAGPSLLRAIVLAEALGRPQFSARGMRRPSADRP